jgi:hypothetical protein
MTMELKDIGRAIAAIGLPLLGAALPVPGGMAIGTALAQAINSPSAKPEDILATLTNNAEALQKAREFEATNHAALVQIAVSYELEQSKLESGDLATVNATMQAEAGAAANENWWQKGWRPFCGYVVALGSLVAVVFVCVLFYQAMAIKEAANLATVVAMVPQLALAITSVLAVPGAAVGITAWHRGRMQVAQIMKDVP